jgi:hypothetical protein
MSGRTVPWVRALQEKYEEGEDSGWLGEEEALHELNVPSRRGVDPKRGHETLRV